MTEIVILNEEATEHSTSKPGSRVYSMIFPFHNPEYYDGEYFYFRLSWRVYPDNASDKTVTMAVDAREGDDPGIEIDESGLIKAWSDERFTITLYADDGSNRSTKVFLTLY